jgi:hypothetical protein
MTSRRAVTLVVLGVVLLAVPLLIARFGVPWERAVGGSGRGGGSASSRIDAEAPEGVRIRVEVLNASDVRGLARRATLHLRDRRFDVVYFGTARPMRDSTVVIDRSNHPEWARLVADALGGVPVIAEPDTSRYLDVTVFLGPDWAPPPEPLYP